MTDDTQAVVDTEPVASPTGGESSAQEPTLEQLLDEYDRGVQRTPPESTPQYAPPPEAPPVDWSRIQRYEQKLFMEEVNEAADKIFGEINVPQKAKIGWLDQMAREIPEAAAAFTNRHQNPRQWGKWQRYLSKTVESEFRSPVDKGATEDREAVAAAVRGASTKVTAEPPPKLGNMSNSEYRKYVRDSLGFDPGV